MAQERSADTSSYIILFKQKDQRVDKKTDKADLLQSAVKTRLNIMDVASPKRTVPAMPAENVALDVNEYEAPIMAASLSEEEATTVRRDPNVESIEPDGKCYALPIVIEGQPTVLTETIPWGIDRIRAPQAWDVTKGKGIRVAVVDTGIDYTHDELSANYRGGTSCVPAESDPKDYNRHGTHVAGTIAASLNDTGVVGVAPSAYLYAVKVLSSNGSGNWSWFISGIYWCIKNGMQVLNMSLGSSDAPPSAVEKMCNLAWKRGLILVAAAGNDAGPVNYPAKYDSVIAVSAIDSANVIAPFSSRGQEVELCAPGVNILSTEPGNRFGLLSGTSMATPHVAGVAALALSSHRWSSGSVPHNEAVKRILAATADKMGVPGRTAEYGFGRVDAEESAFTFQNP
jgi:subtilisin